MAHEDLQFDIKTREQIRVPLDSDSGHLTEAEQAARELAWETIEAVRVAGEASDHAAVKALAADQKSGALARLLLASVKSVRPPFDATHAIAHGWTWDKQAHKWTEPES
jgi:hypothetical protein